MYLAHRICASGSRAALVDSDVGQKDVGPPATITLARIDSDEDLSRLKVAGMYFVGALSPNGHFLPMVVGVRRLVDAADTPFIIINTTGMVGGAGRALKTSKIDAIQPDVIVTLEKNAELQALVRMNRQRNIVRLEPSPRVKSKSPEERAATRRRAFQTYFQSAEKKVFSLDDLVVQRSVLFNGRPIEEPAYLYMEENPDGRMAVSGSLRARSPAGVRVIEAGFEQSLLCGLADAGGDGVGLAIVDRIDFRGRSIAFFSPAPTDRIKVIQFGDLYVATDGRELSAPVHGVTRRPWLSWRED